MEKALGRPTWNMYLTDVFATLCLYEGISIYELMSMLTGTIVNIKSSMEKIGPVAGFRKTDVNAIEGSYF